MSRNRDFAALVQLWHNLEEAGIPLEPLEIGLVSTLEAQATS